MAFTIYNYLYLNKTMTRGNTKKIVDKCCNVYVIVSFLRMFSVESKMMLCYV